MINTTLVLNTIQKEIRSKGLIFTFIFALGGLLLSYKLSTFFSVNFGNVAAADQVSTQSQKVLFWFIGVCSNLVAIILASSTVRSDISTRVLPQMLAFPISRFEYLLSRLTGTWILTIGFYILCLIFGFGLLMSAGTVKLSAFSILVSIIVMGLELGAVVLFCAFISLYGNRLVSFISSVVLYFISLSFTTSLHKYDSVSIKKIINVIMYYGTPRLGEMSEISRGFIYGNSYTASQLAVVVFHFIATSVIWLYIMKMLFDRKEV